MPDQVPRSAVSVCPTSAVPEMVGGEVFDGAVALAAFPGIATSASVTDAAATAERAEASSTARFRLSCLMSTPPSQGRHASILGHKAGRYTRYSDVLPIVKGLLTQPLHRTCAGLLLGAA